MRRLGTLGLYILSLSMHSLDIYKLDAFPLFTIISDIADILIIFYNVYGEYIEHKS
jgi:hypothetical protein